MTRERNLNASKVTLLAINASVNAGDYRAYATVFVHRSASVCNIYCRVSKASVDRVMRAQRHILMQTGAER